MSLKLKRYRSRRFKVRISGRKPLKMPLSMTPKHVIISKKKEK